VIFLDSGEREPLKFNSPAIFLCEKVVISIHIKSRELGTVYEQEKSFSAHKFWALFMEGEIYASGPTLIIHASVMYFSIYLINTDGDRQSPKPNSFWDH